MCLYFVPALLMGFALMDPDDDPTVLDLSRCPGYAEEQRRLAHRAANRNHRKRHGAPRGHGRKLTLCR